MFSQRICRYKTLAIAVACAFALPLAVQAQTTPTEQQLATQVAQLEQQVQQLKEMVQAQQVAPQPAPPQQAAAPPIAESAFSTGPGISVALHGWIDATMFAQNRPFSLGNGQNALWPTPGGKGSLFGGDVRNTRFWLQFTGPNIGDGWSTAGMIQMDFFGGFANTGAYGGQAPNPRLRLAYVDAKNSDTGTVIRVGQDYGYMVPLGALPESLTHVTFPLANLIGWVGWRWPGIQVMQDLNPGTTGLKWRLDAAVFDGSWSGPGDNTNFMSAANVDFNPQLDARLHVQGKDWMAYLSGRYEKFDLRGVGSAAPTPVKSEVKSYGMSLGANWHPGPWTLQGQVYQGIGLGSVVGALAQFGNIHEKGGYGQVGYSFTPNWSVYGLLAKNWLHDQDVINWMGHGSSGLLGAESGALDLIYKTGPYNLGLELMHSEIRSTKDGVDRLTTSGNQLSVSARYNF